MASTDLLKDGLSWQVDDRHNIKIWEDKWLSTPTSYRTQSPVLLIPPYSRVAPLMYEHIAQ